MGSPLLSKAWHSYRRIPLSYLLLLVLLVPLLQAGWLDWSVTGALNTFEKEWPGVLVFPGSSPPQVD